MFLKNLFKKKKLTFTTYTFFEYVHRLYPIEMAKRKIPNSFSSLPNFEISKSRAEKAFSDIVSLFPSDKISISLYSSEERLFRSFTHSRYIRCKNDGLTRRLSFSDSFDVFDAPGTRPPFDFFYNRDSTEISQMYQDRELELQRRSKKSEMDFSSEL